MPNKSGPAPKAETDQKTSIIGTNVTTDDVPTFRRHDRQWIVLHLIYLRESQTFMTSLVLYNIERC